MYLTDLAAVLRDAGLDVVELPGWKSRGRPASSGPFDPIGNLWHHTGSTRNDRAYADWMANDGRSDLPAPLCQVAVDRAGRFYVSAAGRANHAGTARATGPMPAGDGNALYLGWECMNSGSEGWSSAQYDAMVTAAAATSLHYGWSAAANRGHRETSVTGKWDPGLLDLDKFRRDIADHMEDPMADYAKQLDRIERQSKKNGRLTYQRDMKILDAVEALARDAATKQQIRRLRAEVAALADDGEGDSA